MNTEDRLRMLRQLYESGQYREAWALYLGDTESESVEWHWYGSLACWRVGNRAQSRTAAERGMSLGPTGEWAVKFHHRLAVTNLAFGESGLAIEHCEACLRDIDQYPVLSRFLKGAVLYNLALAYGYRWSDASAQRKAVESYKAAAAEFRREDLRDHLRQCLQNLAWAVLTVGDVATAGDALAESDGLCETEEHRGIQAVTEAFLAHAQGRHRDALDYITPWLEQDSPADAQVLAHCVAALAAADLIPHDSAMVDVAKRMSDNAVMLAMDRDCMDQTCVDAQYVQRRVYGLIKGVRGA